MSCYALAPQLQPKLGVTSGEFACDPNHFGFIVTSGPALASPHAHIRERKTFFVRARTLPEVTEVTKCLFSFTISPEVIPKLPEVTVIIDIA